MNLIKNTFKKPWLSVVVYFLIIWTVTATTWVVPQIDGFFTYLITALLATWLLLKLSGQTWKDLNLLPRNKANYWQLFIGTVIGVIMLLIVALPIVLFTGQQWRLNSNFRFLNLLTLSIIFLISSISQEVTYRGYPFQTLLRHYGSWVAQVAIILPFAFMHFHYDMSISEIPIMILSTGLGSLLYGQAYINTKNLALPIGLHWGWNLAQVLFPRHESQNGNGVFIIEGNRTDFSSNLLLIMYLLVTLVAYFLLFEKQKKG